jgi:hypothetical protein
VRGGKRLARWCAVGKDSRNLFDPSEILAKGLIQNRVMLDAA